MGNTNQPDRRSGDAGSYSGPERRHDYLKWRANVDRRLEEGSATMKQLSADIAENTATTKQVQTDTSELVELLRSFKGAFSVLEKLGKLAKPLGYIAMAASAIVGFWAALKGGTGGGR